MKTKNIIISLLTIAFCIAIQYSGEWHQKKKDEAIIEAYKDTVMTLRQEVWRVRMLNMTYSK